MLSHIDLMSQLQKDLHSSVSGGAYLILPSGKKLWARAIAPWENGCRLAAVRVLTSANDVCHPDLYYAIRDYYIEDRDWRTWTADTLPLRPMLQKVYRRLRRAQAAGAVYCVIPAPRKWRLSRGRRRPGLRKIFY